MPNSPRIPGYRFLHSPGPTRVPDEVLHAMSRQPMDLADPRVSQVIAACETGLKRLLGTVAADVLMYAANGHGVWEGVIANLLGPGDAVLVPGTGHFSDGWALQAQAFGAVVIRTPWVEGEPIDPNAVERGVARRPAAPHQGGVRRAHRHRQRRHERHAGCCAQRSMRRGIRRCS